MGYDLGLDLDQVKALHHLLFVAKHLEEILRAPNYPAEGLLQGDLDHERVSVYDVDQVGVFKAHPLHQSLDFLLDLPCLLGLEGDELIVEAHYFRYL